MIVYRLIKSVFALAAFLNIFSLFSIACSYADGHLGSTHYDLIRKAEAILVAEPVSKSGNKVDFKIIEVLKGNFRDKVFQGTEVHNSCIDYSYSVESILPPALAQKLPKVKYVLFLNNTPTGWKIWDLAADRMNTRVFDSDSSAFLKTVKQYVRISSINNYEIEKRELRKLRSLARSGRNAMEYPKDLVADIDHHLKSPTPNKSYQDLVRLYAHSSKEKQREVLWAFAWGKHKEAADFFINLLKSPLPLNYIGPISEYITQTKNEMLLVRLGKNYPKLDKQARWPLMWALIRTADNRHINMMLAALKSADKEEAGRLVEWFVRYPVGEATEICGELLGKNYQENWELAFGLAGLGYIGTIEWARRFMNTSDEDRWMAYYVIARSPLEEADKLAKSVIEGNNPKDLITLIQGYKESQNPNRWNRLRDIINLDSRDSDVDYWLQRTLAEMTEEGDSQAAELLRMLKK